MGERGRRCVGRGASGGCGNRITDIACGSVSRPGKRPEVGCSFAIERERPSALDRVAWTGVKGSFRLEQWQHSFGAIGSPVCDKATVFFAQRYPIGFEIVVRCHFSTVVERASSFFTPKHISACRVSGRSAAGVSTIGRTSSTQDHSKTLLYKVTRISERGTDFVNDTSVARSTANHAILTENEQHVTTAKSVGRAPGRLEYWPTPCDEMPGAPDAFARVELSWRASEACLVEEARPELTLAPKPCPSRLGCVTARQRRSRDPQLLLPTSLPVGLSTG